MTQDRAKRLAQLRQAYESGILDEDPYRPAVAALDAQPVVQARVTGPGAVAQQGAVAATAGGIAIGGSVHGGVHTSGQPADDDAETQE